MKAIIRSLVVVVSLAGASVFAADTKGETGTVQGVVFTADADGGRSVVPGAKVSLTGLANRETEADIAGKYVFNALPTGSYNLKAQAPGMVAIGTVVVTAGAVSESPLEMRVDAVSESTTVTATADTVGTQGQAGSNTVGESAVKDMPNVNERFESLLPGARRGPRPGRTHKHEGGAFITERVSCE
jgi:hypothetical protein